MAKYKPGQSGNPNGRPKGSSDRRNIFKAFVIPYKKELIEKALKMALEGNELMLRLFLERLLPPKPREELIPLEINLTHNFDYKDRCKAIDNALDKGEIDLSTYKVLADTALRRFEGIEVNERLKVIENDYEERRNKEA